MGCDIHLYREVKRDGKWATADIWSPNEYDGIPCVRYEDRAYCDRHYDLFGLLASGVRGRDESYAFEPRGVPSNVSSEVRAEIDRWDGDGHTHSFLYLFELRELAEHLEMSKVRIEGMKDAEGLRALRASLASENPDWGLLYPYCKCTTANGYERFAVDAPANFMVGGGLQKIIDSFDGIDGENHRIVFFFDN